MSAVGNANSMVITLVIDKNIDLKWKQKYKKTKATEKAAHNKSASA